MDVVMHRGCPGDESSESEEVREMKDAVMEREGSEDEPVCSMGIIGPHQDKEKKPGE